jgi:dCMP deaminase
MSLVGQTEFRTPCFAPCADCNCQPPAYDYAWAQGPFTTALMYDPVAEALKKQLEWDLYFLNMAKTASIKSKDPSTKTGAVITRPDHSVASIGFNGFPAGMPDDASLYENREEKYSRIVHCEMNAVMYARERLQGYTLYTWPFASCDRCVVHMIQAGITRFVAPVLPAHLEDRWGASLAKTKQYLRECGHELVEIEFD